MERPMTEWNDDRLDELNGRVKDGFIAVDKRFEQVDERFIRLEGEMKEGFEKVDQRFIRLGGEMKEGFEKADERFATREEMGEVKVQLDRLNDRFDRLIFVLIAACVGLIGTFLVAAVGLIVQS